ncbi:DUF1827 family protein [Enterococcus sp. HY326]|uniref:DUF1827 family protein n=1 Tax=Enterococcus sp. HY326 TaxID=2971265 RepID=UPI00223F0D22|nr:DUF1827 family protein [Enterococcus sp. HY326]
MKLIETPINSNLNLENTYPNITKYIFDSRAVKFYKMYSLDRNQIIYADLYDVIRIVMINTKKKITKQEVDFTIHRLLHATREQVKVTVGVKEKMTQAGFKFTQPRKDIVVIEMSVPED